MPSATSRRSNEGYYFIVVDGVPPYCQWQELKDYLRDPVKVTPGFAQVLKVNEDGTRLGYCPVRNKAEAIKAFDYLVSEGWRGLDIRVSACRKADSNANEMDRIRGPEPSKRRRLPTSVPPMPTLPTPPLSAIQQMHTTTAVSSYDMKPMAKTMRVNTVPGPGPRIASSIYAQYPQTPSSTSASTVSSASTAYGRAVFCCQKGYPVRPLPAAEPAERVYTDRQAIHISRLPHDIEPKKLKEVLSKFGTVSDIVIKRGKEKRCSATAKFQSSSQANLAIEKLDGARMNKLNISVRLDRSEASSSSHSSSSASGGSDDSDSSGSRRRSKVPLVVNGARGPTYYKKTQDADDSLSEGEAQTPQKVQSSSKSTKRLPRR